MAVIVAPTERLQEHIIAAAPFVRGSDIAGGPDQLLSPDRDAVVCTARGHLLIRRTDGSSLAFRLSTDDDHPAISPDGRTVALSPATPMANGRLPRCRLGAAPPGS